MAQGRNKRTAAVGRMPNFPRLLGGALCLDYANTIEGPRSDHPVDFLHDYTDVARWTGHVGALDADDVDQLLEVASRSSDMASATFERALVLRAAIQDVFGCLAARESPADDALARVQREYVAALAEARLEWSENRLAWSWHHRPNDLRRPTWLVAESALRLLTEGDVRRVRECPGAGDCGWLFYDTSPTGRRRWCSMEGCGSRVKMRRHYALKRPRG